MGSEWCGSIGLRPKTTNLRQQGEYRADEHEEKRRREEAELNEKSSTLKWKKFEATMHCEGDSDVEEPFVLSESDSDDGIPIATLRSY